MIIKKYTEEKRKDLIRTGVYCIFHEKYPNKYYVGSTCIKNNTLNLNQGFNLRWRLHIYYLKKNKHHSSYLQNLVNKYGMEGLKFKILEFEEENILKREEFWINKLDSYKNGYNCSKYAVTSKGRKPSNEALKKPVCKYNIKGELLEEYDSARNAIDYNYKQISKCCNGILYSYKGFIWRFKNDSFNKFKIQNKQKNKKVLQLNKEGELIKKWDSATIASKTLNISLGNISSCINNKRKNAGGFIWILEEMSILHKIKYNG